MQKKHFSLDLEKIPTEALRPFTSHNNRVKNRFAERELSNLLTFIKIKNENIWHPVLLLDYSIDGLGLLVKSKLPMFCVETGETIQVKLMSPSENIMISQCRVENSYHDNRGYRIGVSRLNYTPADSVFAEPPALTPIEENPVYAVLEIPFLFREHCFLKLTGVSTNRSLSFFSTDSSLLIFPQMEVDIDFNLPSSERNRFKGIVDWIKFQQGGICFGLKFLELSHELSESIGEYFLTNLIGSPAQIRNLGFYFRVFQSTLRFAYAENDEDYKSVLKLRTKAYIEAGKKENGTLPSEMASSWDKKSRILCAFSGNKIIASVALTFPTKFDSTLRSESGFPEKKYPITIAEKENLIEVVNLCTDSDYRNGDLLSGMFTHLARSFLLSDRNYIVTLCTPELYPLYIKIGFSDSGYSVPFLNISHHLIYGHKHTALYGKNLHPLIWNLIYGNLVEDLLNKNMLVVSWRIKVMIVLKRLLNPFSVSLYKKKMNQQFQKLMNHAIT